MSKIVIVILIYRRHKPMDVIYHSSSRMDIGLKVLNSSRIQKLKNYKQQEESVRLT
jgi:hypothetical protein